MLSPRRRRAKTVITTNPARSVTDTLETNSDKFIGKPLKRLYNRHAFSWKSFVLFLENADGTGRKRLGADPNLSLIILNNKQYADYPVVDIHRYYEEIHVIINPPEEKDADADD